MESQLNFSRGKRPSELQKSQEAAFVVYRAMRKRRLSYSFLSFPWHRTTDRTSTHHLGLPFSPSSLNCALTLRCRYFHIALLERERAAMPPASILESLLRRPQRLILLVTAVLLLLSFSTWLSLSPTSYDRVKTQWQSLPQVPRPWSQKTTPANAGALASAAQSVEDMYSFNPGTPSSPQELAQWGHKGDDGNIYPPEFIPQKANKAPRAKAGFIVLVRNSELQSMKESMRDVEDRFNRKYGYPWIFLNNEPFSDDFKKGVKQMTRSEVRFGFVEKKHWGYPEWIDQNKAAETRRIMKDKNIIYGDSESYRHMCRFQSGFFFQHPLTMDLDYYWRVEPGIKLYCDIDYDPFVFMQMNNKVSLCDAMRWIQLIRLGR